MNVSWSPLKFVLEEADEARLRGDNYKAEALINIAYDILDKQCAMLQRDGEENRIAC
jgi:hypothetical protein